MSNDYKLMAKVTLLVNPLTNFSQCHHESIEQQLYQIATTLLTVKNCYVIIEDHEYGLRKNRWQPWSSHGMIRRPRTAVFVAFMWAGRASMSWWIDRQGRGSERDHDLRTDQRSQVHTRVRPISDDLTIHCFRPKHTTLLTCIEKN